jgi:hypothetical protein|tara:strand:- start:874 stop:1296 length:423 start_codon:yes stop_codon:yes gene_type:complete
MTKSMAEIIDEIEKQKTSAAQTKLLKKYASAALKAVIGYGMDPGVKFLLPETDPPFRPMPEGSDAHGRLIAEHRKFIYFVDSPDGRRISNLKREQMFIQMLEVLDVRDAQLVLRMKNHGLKVKMDAVKAAFPNLTANWKK